MAFKLGDEEGFRWGGAYEISADDLLDGNAVTIRELDEKQENTIRLKK